MVQLKIRTEKVDTPRMSFELTAPFSAIPGVGLTEAVLLICQLDSSGADPRWLSAIHADMPAIAEQLREHGRIEASMGRLKAVDVANIADADSLAAAHLLVANAIELTSLDAASTAVAQATHLHAAGKPDQAWEVVFASCEQSADAGDPLTAINRLAHAVDLIGVPPADVRYLKLQAQWAASIGNVNDAYRCWTAVERRAGSAGDSFLVARSLVEQARLATYEPDLHEIPGAEGARAGDLKLAQAVALGTAGGAWSQFAGLILHANSGNWQRVADACADALASARRERDHLAEIQVLNLMTIASSIIGADEPAIEPLSRALSLARQHHEIQWVAPLYSNLSEEHAVALQTDQALQAARDFVSYMQLHHATVMTGKSLVTLASRLTDAGLQSDAEAAIAASDSMLDQNDSILDLLRCEVARGAELTLMVNNAPATDIEAARSRRDELISRAIHNARESDVRSWIIESHLVNLERHAESGSVEAALAAREHVGDEEILVTARAALALARGGLWHSTPALTVAARTLLEAASQDSAPALVQLILDECRSILNFGSKDAPDMQSIVDRWNSAGRMLDGRLAQYSLSILAGTTGSRSERVNPRARAQDVMDRTLTPAAESQFAALAGLTVGLVDHDAEEVESAFHIVDFARESSLSGRLGDGDHICVVAEGIVRAFRTTDDGRQIPRGALMAGDWLVVDADGALCFEAETKARVLAISAARLASLAGTIPLLTVNAETVQQQAQACLHSYADDMSALSVEQRCLSLLARLAAAYGRPTLKGAALIDIQISHEGLARLIGASRPHTSVVMSALKKDGRIDMWKRRIIIIDESILDASSAKNESGSASRAA